MYSPTLFIHSWLRWALLIAMVILFIRSYQGWKGTLSVTPQYNKLRLITVILFDIQALVGYVLYFLSPIVQMVFEDPSIPWIKDTQTRFYVMEHITSMTIAVIVLHVGNVIFKKKEEDALKFKTMTITLTIVAIIVLTSIPWPMLEHGRVLFRGW